MAPRDETRRRSHSRRSQDTAEQPGLGVGNGHHETLESGDLGTVVDLSSVHLEAVDESILFSRCEESGFLGMVGKDEDADDGDTDGGDTFDQAARKK